MRVTLRQIEAFRAIMVHGTVTQAAQRLHTSQPSVSRSIQELETATGLHLFKRAKRRIEPTSAASELYKEVNRAFTGLEDIARAAEAIRGSRNGAVRVVCFPAFSEGFMAEVFRRFLVHHPKARLTLDTQHTPTIVEAIAAHRFDIGLAGYDLQVAEATSERLTTADQVCVLPANHVLAAKSVITPADLRDIDFISGAANELTRRRTDEVFNAAGVSRRSVVEVVSATVICAMVVRGMGVSIINPFTAAAFQPDLVMRPFSVSLPFVATLLRPKHRPNSTLTNVMVDEIKKYITEIEAAVKG
ncbi:LysR family transcriptional regulator [Acidisphaera sp. S103]|uniref:LysR family transcriptional regulator n=1 Tax=Acidisphaera sp. S103 TaxID=1747223 RepID=UPI00131CB7F4|nr:LysR family transcriptional regulator [Acidisphaera sp. S103]